jgi:hypothetical protein
LSFLFFQIFGAARNPPSADSALSDKKAEGAGETPHHRTEKFSGKRRKETGVEIFRAFQSLSQGED